MNKKIQTNKITQLQEWTNETISQTTEIYQNKVQEWKKMCTDNMEPILEEENNPDEYVTIGDKYIT